MSTIKPTDFKPVVLVTGGAGYIGTHLVSALVGSYRVACLDVREPCKLPAGAEWLECDLTDDARTRAAIKSVRDRFGKVASVVHLAAYCGPCGEPSPMYEELTVQGTRRLIDSLSTFDKVEQLVFSSSLLVMKPEAESDGKPSGESPSRAEWDYPRSKLRAERLLKEYAGPVPIVILRLAGVYDEMCHCRSISEQIRRIYERDFESYLFPGDTERGQPHLHVEDAAKCIVRVIEKRRDLCKFDMFLIGEPEVMSCHELQNEIGVLIHGREWPSIRIPRPLAMAAARVKEALSPADSFVRPWLIELADDHYPIEMRHARNSLGWSPRYRLRDVIPAMIERLRRDPRGWYAENNIELPYFLREGEKSTL